jgi:tRNA dimethylallyltransferase
MKAAARLVAILGPTASGKSALALCLAERLGGEIVVCDSTQVYRHFDIGTAKVPVAERRGIPHHMIDLVEPDEVFTAGEYCRQAGAVLEDMRRRDKLPIFTVGTGLYLRALLEGLADAPTRSEELRARMRQRAEAKGSTYLHRILRRLDAGAAGRIAPRDVQKVIRAIEICILAGKPVSEVHAASRAGLAGYVVHKVGLNPPRAELYARIGNRVTDMLRTGWLDEIRQLSAGGIPSSAKPFQFIGYSELRGSQGRGDVPEDAVPRIQQATRQYAKRQLTWFRKEPGVEWFAGFGDSDGLQSDIIQYLANNGIPAASIPSSR